MRPIASGKVKILHLIASRGLGGAERILLTLLGAIDRKKFDLIVGTFVDQRENITFFWNEAEKLNVSLEPIRFGNPYDLSQILQVYRILRKHNPNIIHAHGYKTNILGFLVAKLLRLPIVTTVHGLHSGRNKALIWLSLRLLRHFDRIIAVSDQIKQELETIKVPTRKIITIRNIPSIRVGENSASGSTFKEEIGISPDSKLIGFVGRLEPVKGCCQFIKAIPKVAENYPNCYFVVVGDGTERRSLESLARELGIENRVYFCGFQGDPVNVFQSLDL